MQNAETREISLARGFNYNFFFGDRVGRFICCSICPRVIATKVLKATDDKCV